MILFPVLTGAGNRRRLPFLNKHGVKTMQMLRKCGPLILARFDFVSI
jgi:hypothetical protein